MATNELSGDFMVDYDETNETTTITTFQDDRSVCLRVRPLVNAKDRRLLGYEASIVRGVFIPSLELRRAGWMGAFANDVLEEVIADAKVGDLVAALQWLTGNVETSPGA